ncbi:hypothetical protein M2H08_21090 [Vibrio vulnificus]|nr:hypothetical protein [Vibrio vulnificus]MCU8155039.1 hypothetical protein [Vibrio vulnificus]
MVKALCSNFCIACLRPLTRRYVLEGIQRSTLCRPMESRIKVTQHVLKFRVDKRACQSEYSHMLQDH